MLHTAFVFLFEHGGKGQLHAGCPTLDLLVQRVQFLAGQFERQAVAEEIHCFRVTEAQIGLADLIQTGFGAPVCQVEGRVAACGDDHMHVRRLVLDEVIHDLVDRIQMDVLIIIQHQCNRCVDLAQAVQQDVQLLDGGVFCVLEVFRDDRVQLFGGELPECLDQVVHEARGVVIAFIQRQPGRLVLIFRDPVSQQAGFPKAGRCGDQGDAFGDVVFQCRGQPPTSDGTFG